MAEACARSHNELFVDKEDSMEERPSSDPLDPVFIRAYGLSFVFISRTLLEFLKPKLSPVEREYVDDLGPRIVQARLAHSLGSMGSAGTTTEGKAARQEGERLEGLAVKRFTDVGVSADRQALLNDLVFGANADFYNLFPPQKIGDVKYHAGTTFSQGKLTRFKELAGLLDAPREIREYLSLLLDAARQMTNTEVKAA